MNLSKLPKPPTEAKLRPLTEDELSHIASFSRVSDHDLEIIKRDVRTTAPLNGYLTARNLFNINEK